MTSRAPILVGVDGTDRSDAALNAAVELSSRLGHPLQLLHALEPDRHPEDVDPEQVRKRVRGGLEGRLSGARLAPAGEDLDVHVRRGHPARVLVDHAREHDAGLIVLGEHRRRGLLDLGSTGAGVIAHAPCPVWCQNGPVRAMRRLVVALDFSDESRAALDLASAWAAPLDAEVHALHLFVAPDFMVTPGEPHPGPTYTIDHERDNAREELERCVAGCAHPERVTGSELVEAEPLEALPGLLGEHDVLLMGSHGHTGLAAALLGSVTRGMLRHATVPVVVTSSEAARRGERSWLL